MTRKKVAAKRRARPTDACPGPVPGARPGTPRRRRRAAVVRIRAAGGRRRHHGGHHHPDDRRDVVDAITAVIIILLQNNPKDKSWQAATKMMGHCPEVTAAANRMGQAIDAEGNIEASLRYLVYVRVASLNPKQ